MVKLHQFKRYFGLPNPSPFCIKVECWLRMNDIEYENVWVSNPSKLPKGKAPAIEHDGRMITDSTFIIDYLRQHFGCTLDAALSPQELSAAHAFERMIEERSYWILVYSRWVDDSGWPQMKAALFRKMPVIVRDLIPAMLRQRMRMTLHKHGIGRHSAEEIYRFGARDLQAISGWLQDKDFFMGDKPTSVDATVFGFVANALHNFDNPLTVAANSHDNLIAYAERMRLRYFADIDQDSPKQRLKDAHSPQS